MQGAEGLSATDGCVGGSFPAESPSRALRAASWKGGIQGEGKGVRPKASQSAKDFLIELPERDNRSVMKKPWFPRGIRSCGGWRFAPTTTYTVLFSGQEAFSSPC